jgi:dihydrofolate reductase
VSSTVLYMSMSLDGFVTGPNVRPDNGLGDGGERLHEWAFPDGDVDLTGSKLTGANRTVWEEMMATGAVIAGRQTFEPAGGWGGDHHDGVPIFIVARNKPGIDVSAWPLVTYVSDVTEAVAEAKRAAGDRNVLFHGATAARLALDAGGLDELEIHLVPVLLGQGTRLFGDRGPEQVELERTRVLEGDGVTHMHYLVKR